MTRSWAAVGIVGSVLLSLGACALEACATPDLDLGDDSVGLPGRVEPSDSGEAAERPDSGLAEVDARADADAAPVGLRVFVSSSLSAGNLGGLGAADVTCTNLATTAKLGGKWAAWLSDNGGAGPHAIDRVTSAGPWRLVSGELVASTKAGLASGTLAHAIDHDEKGTAVPSSRVWTGTGPDGQFFAKDCDKWTTGTNGRVGVTSAVDATWTSADADDCSGQRRIYCFEL
jgi:hypothetical protein